MLAAWPAAHHGYRASDVAQLSALLDEAVAELRVAAGLPRVDLTLVATGEPAACQRCPSFLLPRCARASSRRSPPRRSPRIRPNACRCSRRSSRGSAPRERRTRQGRAEGSELDVGASRQGVGGAVAGAQDRQELPRPGRAHGHVGRRAGAPRRRQRDREAGHGGAQSRRSPRPAPPADDGRAPRDARRAARRRASSPAGTRRVGDAPRGVGRATSGGFARRSIVCAGRRRASSRSASSPGRRPRR